MKIIGIAVVSILLSGCASQQLEMSRFDLELQGLPQPYIDAYLEGCNAGKSAAGNPDFKFSGNVGKFEQNETYSLGWANGFGACKSEYENSKMAQY